MSSAKPLTNCSGDPLGSLAEQGRDKDCPRADAGNNLEEVQKPGCGGFRAAAGAHDSNQA